MQAVSVEIEIHENLPPIARAWNANCSVDLEQNSKDEPLAKNTLTGVGIRRIGARVTVVAMEAVAAKSNLFRGGFQSFRVLHERVPQSGIIQQDFWHS